MLRLVTAVSSYPFYNFRYLKLLSEFSRYFSVYVFANSRSKKTEIYNESEAYRVYYLSPSITPKRISHYYGGMISQFFINLVKPDVVWIFDITALTPPIRINKPIVLDIDDPVFKYESKLSQIRDLCILRNKNVKRIIVTTHIIKNKFFKQYGILTEKIEIIPYGIDLRLFRPTKIPDENIVLYYGTLAPHRSNFLSKVIVETLARRRDVRFIILGDIPVWFREYLRRKNLTENVVMPGYVEHDKLPDYIKKARVCIFTQDISLGGRLSFKLLEYMASGRPIVATDVDESWPVKESGAGIISPIDPKIFAEKIIQLLEDDKLAEELAEKGVRYARRFSWDDMVRKYLKLFIEILKE